MTQLLAAREVALGDTVCDLRLPWWRHAFMRSSFLVDTPQLLARVKELGHHEVLVARAPAAQATLQAMVAPAIHEDVSQAGSPALAAPQPLIGGSVRQELGAARLLVQAAQDTLAETVRQARAGAIVNLGDVRATSQDIVAAAARSTDALLTLVILQSRHRPLFDHSVAVAAFMTALGRTLGLSDEALVLAAEAGLLHDLGMASLPPDLVAAVGAYTPEQRRQMQSHVSAGVQLLRAAGHPADAALLAVGQHHERLDGSGYPAGTKAELQGPLARMLAVCDTYEALTSELPTSKALEPAAALAEIARGAPHLFDERIVRAFVQTMGVYPDGLLVRLTSNRLAIVLAQNRHALDAPVVWVFHSCRTRSMLTPFELDLSTGSDSVGEPTTPQAWGLTPEQLVELLPDD